MSSNRATDDHKSLVKSARPPQSAQERAPEADPAGQSPEDPIEFSANDEVARGNEERANAEPEPAGLHAAEVPGKPDVAAERRHDAAKRHDS
jgi:hypothetical protein